MTDAAENEHARCAPPPGLALLALLALLLACGSEADATRDDVSSVGNGSAGDAATLLLDAALSGSVTDASQGSATPERDAGSALERDAASASDADASSPSAFSDAGSSDSGRDASVRDAGATDAASDASAPSQASGFVGAHGALRVQGNRVVDRDEKPVQLRGMSLFWSQWSDFYVAKNVDVLVDDWKATLVRAALGVENEAGYLQSPQANVEKVRAVVDRAIERGVYVIIDWHDHNAQDHVTQATAFFEEMARAYGEQPHVIFEIFNEPLQVPWPSVKAYAEPLIRKMRAAGAENLIIVGTPSWSQDVDLAANDPITSDANVAYTLHFYANTHKQALRAKAKTALDRGLALFVTEWGTCSADGNGTIDEAETRTWLSFLKDNAISWANWALNNKAEACSALTPASTGTGPWRNDQLTPSGALVKGAIP